jgi:hypothetical protein
MRNLLLTLIPVRKNTLSPTDSAASSAGKYAEQFPAAMNFKLSAALATCGRSKSLVYEGL